MLRRWAVMGAVVFAASGAGTLHYLGAHNHKVGDGRLCDSQLLQMEKRLRRHLYAPTWLPEDVKPVENLTRDGVHRVLCDFSDASNQRGLILAQEPRSPERDRYHKERILPTSDLQATVGSERAYFMWGKSGERRLFWRNRESWFVVSSFALSDAELLKVAQSMK